MRYKLYMADSTPPTCLFYLCSYYPPIVPSTPGTCVSPVPPLSQICSHSRFPALAFPSPGVLCAKAQLAHWLASCRSLFKCHLSKPSQHPLCKLTMPPDTFSLLPCVMALLSAPHYVTSNLFYFSLFMSVSIPTLAVLFPAVSLVPRTAHGI